MKWNPLMARLVRGMSGLHTTLYRMFGGRGFLGRNTLILTTRGRKTGREIAIPLLYVEDSGCFYIVGSFGGSDTPPGWYRNLVAHPEVTVEVRNGRQRRRARSIEPAQAARVWPKLLAMYPSYAEYQKKTTRVIPVIELSPVSG